MSKATGMLTRKGGGHRLIVCIRPQATDLTPPLVASDLEAIIAKSLQHGQPAGAWLSFISTLNYAAAIRTPSPAPITATVCCRILTSVLNNGEL
jgi:hypothetical protein